MKIIYFFCLIIICFSCSRSKQTNVSSTFQPELFTEGSYVYYPIKDNRIKVDLDKPQKVSLFDYFKQIELIPLETNDNVLIGWIGKIIDFKNFYYVFDTQRFILYIFDKTSNYVYKIDKRGQGP